MARPTKPNKRERQLNIRLTMAELCWVRDRAAESGMRPTEFCRAKLLAEGPRIEAVEAAQDNRFDRLRLAQLARLGNNLNQVARRPNALRMPEPPDLAQLLKDIRDALAERLRDDH